MYESLIIDVLKEIREETKAQNRMIKELIVAVQDVTDAVNDLQIEKSIKNALNKEEKK